MRVRLGDLARKRAARIGGLHERLRLRGDDSQILALLATDEHRADRRDGFASAATRASARTTKPGGTGIPSAVIRASDAPLPPASSRSVQRASSKNTSISSVLHDRDGPDGRAGGTDPLDRKHAELEAEGAADLVEVHQVLEMPVLLV